MGIFFLYVSEKDSKSLHQKAERTKNVRSFGSHGGQELDESFEGEERFFCILVLFSSRFGHFLIIILIKGFNQWLNLAQLVKVSLFFTLNGIKRVLCKIRRITRKRTPDLEKQQWSNNLCCIFILYDGQQGQREALCFFWFAQRQFNLIFD